MLEKSRKMANMRTAPTLKGKTSEVKLAFVVITSLCLFKACLFSLNLEMYKSLT